MKRKTFFSWSITAASLAALPLQLLAAATSWFRDDKGFKVDAGNDRYDNALKPFPGDEFFL